MEKKNIKIEGSLLVDEVYKKKMGPKEYQFALVKLYAEDGTFVDTATVFCAANHPIKAVLTVYKGQLSIKLAE